MSNITTIRTPNHWLSIAPEVQSALTGKQPVVGFETTVLSFGLPYPSNLQVGRQCEKHVREAGCVPATLGMLDGNVHVGITDKQMETFCRLGSDATKVNLQNMAVAVRRKKAGAFTVAASVQVCAEAGIRIFATGGVGGVHREYSTFHDVSSDMIALARYPVAVVCAGVKSILDVPATIEHLETLGVPVIGYKTEHFPLFHARSSSYPLETHSDSMEEIAAIAQAHWRMGGKGVLVVTPVPEEYAVDRCELEEWIAGAQRAAKTGRVSGKAITPFLLKKLEELSQGKSTITNVALLENNARTAGKLSVALSSL